MGQALHLERVAQRADPDRHRGRGLFDLGRSFLFFFFFFLVVVFVAFVAFVIILAIFSFLLLLADLVLAVGFGVGDRAVGERGAPRGAVVALAVAALVALVAAIIIRIATATFAAAASCLFSFLDLRSHVRIVDQKRLHPVGERDRAVEALVRRRDVDGLRGRRRRQRRFVERVE